MPSVDVGFPTHLNNGQISSVYSDFGNVFSAHPGQCYLIPVVQTALNGSTRFVGRPETLTGNRQASVAKSLIF